jgi:hypothetical protein
VGDKPDPLDSTATDGEQPRAATEQKPGRVVGHYRLGEPLGEGGMGVVYRAQDLKLGRPVAIKFLTRSDEQSRARFLREARAASALDHPNIGTVYEIGEADGAPFIAMALYEGETLRARIRRANLSIDEVVSITRQLCGALAAAHQAGVVHRDLKPANVMLLPDGTLKLLDFGLAKLTSIDESSLTREGAIVGTLAYMSPEQLRSGEIDARADLWALGAVLHELLSGQPPFGSGPAATLVGRILTESPPPLPPNAPSDLAALARRLLAKRPGDRVQDASEVGVLLQRRKAPASYRGYLVGVAVVLAAAGIPVALTLRTPTPTPAIRASGEALAAEFRRGGDPQKLLEAADAYAADGVPERAFELYRSFLSIAVDPPAEIHEHFLEQARALRAQSGREQVLGLYDEAFRHFELSYAVDPDPSALYEAAYGFRKSKQWRQARKLFTKYLDEVNDPGNRGNVEKLLAEMPAEGDEARDAAGHQR